MEGRGSGDYNRTCLDEHRWRVQMERDNNRLFGKVENKIILRLFFEEKIHPKILGKAVNNSDITPLNVSNC